MSATREVICQRINAYEEAIIINERFGTADEKTIQILKAELATLRKQLAVVNEALNEGAQILKG
jgi:hypothetical protein